MVNRWLGASGPGRGDADEAAGPDLIESSRAKTPQETILLVDDDAGLLQLHQLALKNRTGFEIRVALTGPEAIKQINSRQPALVIVDLMMPDMSGIDVCRWIRAQPTFAAIPVVMLTGLADPIVHLEARQAGANDIWLKPISPAELGARIRQLLNQ